MKSKHYILDAALKTTINYEYNFRNYLYLRFCFLLDFFEINDICERLEAKYPHTYRKDGDVYDKSLGIEAYKKSFFHDAIRSNKNKISGTLLPFWNLFLEIIQEEDFITGDIFDTKHIIRDAILADRLQFEALLCDYDSLISFFGIHLADLAEPFSVEDSENNMFCACYNSNLEFWGTCYDDLKYPVYADIVKSAYSHYYSSDFLSKAINNDDIKKNHLYWNMILENWDILFLIFNEPVLWFQFSNIMSHNDIKNIPQVNKLINEQIGDNDYANIKQLMYNTEKYASIINFNFKPPRRNANSVLSKITKLLNSPTNIACFKFCNDNYTILSKLNVFSVQLLYRQACLGQSNNESISMINLNTLIDKTMSRVRRLYEKDL